MKKLRLAAYILVVLLVGAGLIASASWPKGPVYHGYRASAWVKMLGRTPPPVRLGAPVESAGEALRALGPAALPYLVEGIRQRNARGSSYYRKILPQLPKWVQAKLPPALDRAAIARDAMAVLFELSSGDAAASDLEEVIPTLVGTFTDSDRQLSNMAVGALARLAIDQKRRTALNALITGLDATNATVRAFTAFQFLRGGPECAPALEALAGRMTDPSVSVRVNAAMAVYHFGGAPEKSVAILTDALNADSPAMRANAAAQLSLIGPPARAALPALEAAFNDPDAFTRKSAAYAVYQIETQDLERRQSALRLLITFVGDRYNLEVRRDAAIMLGVVGGPARPALPALLDLSRLDSPNGASVDTVLLARAAAREAIKRIDPLAAIKAGIK